MAKRYFTYIVRCSDGSLYTGFTVDSVEKRVDTHNAGKGAKYTRGRRPVTLVWFHEWDTEHEARSAEFHIKRFTRKQKLEIIEKGKISGTAGKNRT